MIKLVGSEESIVREFFKDQPYGRFLELGAKDGEPNGSSEPCWNLLAKGWYGVYCEPNPISCSKLIRNTWPFRTRVSIFNVAVTGSGGLENLYISLDNEYASCASLNIDWMNNQSFVKAPQESYYVVTNTISFIGLLNCTDPHSLNFISIDIEGCDQDVVTSVNWDQFDNLKLVCLEDPSSVSIEHLAKAGFVPMGMTENENVFFVKDFG